MADELGGQSPQGSQTPSALRAPRGLTATPPHNPTRSAGRAQPALQTYMFFRSRRSAPRRRPALTTPAPSPHRPHPGPRSRSRALTTAFASNAFHPDTARSSGPPGARRARPTGRPGRSQRRRSDRHPLLGPRHALCRRERGQVPPPPRTTLTLGRPSPTFISAAARLPASRPRPGLRFWRPPGSAGRPRQQPINLAGSVSRPQGGD